MKKYVNAKDILPAQLVEEIQRYVDGTHLYIPQKLRKSWGSESGAKQRLEMRNLEIQVSFQLGIGIEVLAPKYGLSEERIRSIVYSKNMGTRQDKE